MFSASPNLSASFTWEIMCATKELLSEGIRWRVSNGELIDVWKEKWVPGNTSFTIKTPDLHKVGPIGVSSLLNIGLDGLNMPTINYLF